MKPKHVIILGGLFVVLIGVYFISNKDKSESQIKDGLVAGDKVLSITNINEITGVKITGSENSVQLGRKDGKWVVVNRADYKADFTKISRALKKLDGLEVAEQRRVGKKHYGRFDLEEPESEDGAGVKIQLSKNEQDPVGEIVMGKRYGGATIDSGQQGGGNG